MLNAHFGGRTGVEEKAPILSNATEGGRCLQCDTETWDMAKTHLSNRGCRVEDGELNILHANEITFTFLSCRVQLQFNLDLGASLSPAIHFISGYTSLGSNSAHAAAVAFLCWACSDSIIMEPPMLL